MRSWDALTKWIYDPANKAELLTIAKSAFGGTDQANEKVYQLHVTNKSVPENVRITEKGMQQFVDNLKKAAVENVASDPMKYVDSSLVSKVLNI